MQKSLENAYKSAESFNFDVDASKENGSVNEMPWFSFFTNRLINRVVLCVASFILLLLAVFSPMANTKAAVDDDAQVKLGFTTVDSVKLIIYSFFSLSDYELTQTEEYIAFEDYRERLESGEVGYGDTKEMAEALCNHLFFSVKSAEFSPKISMVVTAVASVAYVLVSLCLFIFSCFALFLELAFKDGKAKIKEKAFTRSVTLVWLLFLLLPTMTYLFCQLCHFGIGKQFGHLSAGGVGVGYGFVLSLVVAFLASAFFAVGYLLKNNAASENKNKTPKIKSAVTLALVICYVISLFLPCVSIKYATNDNGVVESTSAAFGINDMYEFMYDDVVSYMNLPYQNGYSAVLDVVNEAFSDYDDEGVLAFETLNRATLFYTRTDISAMYVVMLFICTAMLAFFAMIALNVLKRVVKDEKISTATRLFAIFELIFSVIYFALTVVISLIANSQFPVVANIDLVFNVGFGPIMCVISSLAILILTLSDKKERVELGYDNADVSFAPYVVGYTRDRS